MEVSKFHCSKNRQKRGIDETELLFCETFTETFLKPRETFFILFYIKVTSWFQYSFSIFFIHYIYKLLNSNKLRYHL
jgi:hypothetical protein